MIVHVSCVVVACAAIFRELMDRDVITNLYVLYANFFQCDFA